MADFPRIKWVNVGSQQRAFAEPQHFTGNGDETVRTGESNPLPTKDGAVEARLQSIEQTQSQILAKLNDTIDTRLTGSIMEQDVRIVKSIFSEDLDDFVGRKITSGSRYEVIIKDVFKSSNTSVGVAFTTQADFTILVQPRNAENTEYLDVNGVAQSTDGKIRAQIFDFNVKSPNARIRITNNGTEDITVSGFTITHHQTGGISK